MNELSNFLESGRTAGKTFFHINWVKFYFMNLLEYLGPLYALNWFIYNVTTTKNEKSNYIRFSSKAKG